MSNLQEISKRLQSASLNITLKKCTFGAHEYDYLGHRVGHEGVCPDETKVKAVQEMKRPCTKKDVKSFLGMLQ